MRFFGKIVALSGLVLVSVGLLSCSKESLGGNTLEQQTSLIKSYITTNRLQDSVVTDNNNLWRYRFIQGNGPKVKNGDRVTLSYVLGYIASPSNLKIYNTNIKSVADFYGLSVQSVEPITVTVGSSGLFKGFDQGLTYLYGGDGALILMPSTLAYGSSGMGSVPGDTPIGVRVYISKVEQ